MSLLDDLLRLQREIRALEELELEERYQEPQKNGAHGGYSGEDPGDRKRSSADIGYGSPTMQGGRLYQSTSSASIPKSTTLVTSGERDIAEVVWADAPKNQLNHNDLKDVPCTNAANCYQDPPCYGDHDCGECEHCLNWECVEKDWNDPCATDSDCPCPPNEDQKFFCNSGVCQLTCAENDDCSILGSGSGGSSFDDDLPPVDEDGNPIDPKDEPPAPCYACNQATGFCGPGCTTDETCVPGSKGEAADSKPGSYCVDCSCVTPCEPPRFCERSADCKDGEFCAEHFGRAPGDPPNKGYACAPGCAADAPCDPIEVWEMDEETQAEVLVSRRVPRCIDNDCVLYCDSDGDCLADEVCDDNECKVVGKVCINFEDCEDGEFCNSDGRCAKGCVSDTDCDTTCPRDRDCVNACQIDPNCTCEEITGEACDGTNWEWMDYCRRDPACVQQ